MRTNHNVFNWWIHIRHFQTINELALLRRLTFTYLDAKESNLLNSLRLQEFRLEGNELLLELVEMISKGEQGKHVLQTSQ